MCAQIASGDEKRGRPEQSLRTNPLIKERRLGDLKPRMGANPNRTLAAIAPASAAPAHPAAAAYAASTHPRPLNDFPGGAAPFAVYNEGYTQAGGVDDACARIDGAGALIMGTGDCGEWFFNVEPGAAYGELVDNNSPSNSLQCLYHDATGARDGINTSYDESRRNPNSPFSRASTRHAYFKVSGLRRRPFCDVRRGLTNRGRGVSASGGYGRSASAGRRRR